VSDELDFIGTRSDHAVQAIGRYLYFGMRVTSKFLNTVTGVITSTSTFYPTRIKHRESSRYVPHQGKRECARRAAA